MRVIAGRARGHKLLAPKGKRTRPTPDRVKEALFSMLATQLDGAHVLDLFAGTGALGIEALSRGAASATFVERDHAAVLLLEKNLATLPGTDATVIVAPVDKALASLARSRARFDIVLADPPFDAQLLNATLADLTRHRLVGDEGIVVCEHHSRQTPPTAPPGWRRHATRRYGDVTLSFYRPDKGDLA